MVSVTIIIKTNTESPDQKIDWFRFSPGEGFGVRAVLHGDRVFFCGRTEAALWGAASRHRLGEKKNNFQNYWGLSK